METQSQSIKELDKSLAFLIEGTTEKGGKLVDWLYEQAPEIVTQLLVWKGIESLINFILGIILIVVPSLLLIKFIPKLKDSIYKFNIKENDKFIIFIILSLIASAIALIPTQISGWSSLNLTWLKIYLAPKVYLLEYVVEVIK